MEPGTIIGGKYRLNRKVGKGGMGTVWAATNTATGTPVAVKLLTTEAASSEEMRQRLVREATVAGRIRHPNIVHFHEVGLTDDNEPFLVMELLQGQTLRQLIRDRGKLDTPTALWVASEIGHALQSAHAASIAHRDLKPGNVFLNRDADGKITLKVVDFGVSKFLAEDQAVLTSTGAAIGSPAYMSPEQAKGDGVDHRTDIWALGIVIFEMIAGRRPFVAESPVALLSQILFAEVPRLRDFEPDVDPVVDAIVSRCLDRQVESRYQTIAQVMAALDARQTAIAEAAAARQSELGAWVDMPTREPQEQSSDPNWEPPSASQSSSQSTSESASQPMSASESRSTTHGLATSVGASAALPQPRREPQAPTSPRLPWVAVAIPGVAVALFFLAMLVLVVRSVRTPAVEESDVLPVTAATAVEPEATTTAATPEAPEPTHLDAGMIDAATTPPKATATPPKATATPTPKATATPAPKATAAPTPKATATPTPKATATPTPKTTATPAPSPTPKQKPCKSPVVDSSGKVIGCLD